MPPSPRIALSVNTSWNVVNFRAGLVRALVAAGHEVIALTPTDQHTSKLAALGCRHVPIAMDNKGTNPIYDASLCASYFQQLRAIRPDIYLGFTIKPNIYGSLAARALGIPVVNNISGLGTAFATRSPLQFLVHTLYRRALKGSVRVFFQNRNDRDVFVANRLVLPEQTDLLPGSGVDLQGFQPAPLAERDPEAAFRFLFVGRVLRDKGVDELIAAVRTLKARGARVQCSLVGLVGAENRTAIGAATVQQWVADGLIDYLGAVDDVRPAIAGADCVVLPSYHEGVPRSLIEAAAMARPIIASDIPGCRAIVVDGENGFLCKVRDADDLAEQMQRMMQLPHARRLAMAAAGRAKAEQEFDERIVIARYLEAIEKCVASGVRAP